MKNIIVGAGPIGLYLATKSPESKVFDQKKQIGTPVQCTGLLTSKANELVSKQFLRQITINTITSTKVIGPKKTTTLELSPNYVIDNRLFEEKLYDKAIKQGANIQLQQKYVRSTTKGHEFKDQQTGKRSIHAASELIGIDGPSSRVREMHNIKPLQYYTGLQVRMHVKEHEQGNKILFYPHIGKYAWYVPETEKTARIGLVTTNTSTNTLQDFLKRFSGRIIQRQGGKIPLHKPFSQTIAHADTHRAVLLGDAGGHIKNTTGGGLVPGMLAAKEYSEQQKAYKGTPRALQQELYAHFLVHNLLASANHKEWDDIIVAAEKQSTALAQHHRDETRKLLLRLGSNKTLLYYSIKKILSGKVKLF